METLLYGSPQLLSVQPCTPCLAGLLSEDVLRPIYETAKDRERENSVRQYLISKYECVYRPTDTLQVFDGYLLYPNETLAAIVEIKTRKNESSRYPTYMISARKWRTGLGLAEEHNVPFMLVVAFTDGVFVTKFKSNYPTALGGRRDRNDAQDMEECIYIPMTDFRKI